ncbi:MAG: AraC family transcriptional regulator [Gammaproteobacteria bacterium]|nr:AraC family transcriptional regulator [Gammaproteobacteria bacterium]
MRQTRQKRKPVNQNLARLEALPQPVVAYGRDLARGDTLAFHKHRRAQLIYASDGIMTVTTRNAAYLVPPQRAVWMPGDIEHQIDARSDVNMRTLYIDPSASADLPVEVCVLNVAALLRELIVAAVANGPEFEAESPMARIMAVILDQIRSQSVASLALPMPADPRLRRVAQGLTDNPGDPRSLGAWASDVGASSRTLVRLFPAQTGLTFRAWRQQRRLLHALELLSTGASVTEVALETGYDNSSAFIAMFRRCLGTTPLRYINDVTPLGESD